MCATFVCCYSGHHIRMTCGCFSLFLVCGESLMAFGRLKSTVSSHDIDITIDVVFGAVVIRIIIFFIIITTTTVTTSTTNPDSIIMNTMFCVIYLYAVLFSSFLWSSVPSGVRSSLFKLPPMGVYRVHSCLWLQRSSLH